MSLISKSTTIRAASALALALGLGCSADGSTTGSAAGLSHEGELGAAGSGDEGASGTLVTAPIECPKGTGEIRVSFDCDEVEITTCRDLSNVVLEFEDGTRQRFEGLSDPSGSFGGTGDNEGKVIASVWVKSGDNASGEGPGYGTRLDAPGDTCTTSGDGDGDGDGEGGDGDGDGTPVECGGLDEDCGGDAPGGDGDGDGTGGDGDGDGTGGDGDGDSTGGDGDGDSTGGDGDGDGTGGDGDGDGDGDGTPIECGLDEDCGGEAPGSGTPIDCTQDPTNIACIVD